MSEVIKDWPIISSDPLSKRPKGLQINSYPIIDNHNYIAVFLSQSTALRSTEYSVFSFRCDK